MYSNPISWLRFSQILHYCNLYNVALAEGSQLHGKTITVINRSEVRAAFIIIICIMIYMINIIIINVINNLYLSHLLSHSTLADNTILIPTIYLRRRKWRQGRLREFSDVGFLYF